MICSLGEFSYGIWYGASHGQGQGWKLTWTPERGHFIYFFFGCHHIFILEVIIFTFGDHFWCKYIASLPWRLHEHDCLQNLPAVFPCTGSCAQVVRDFRDFVTTFKVNKEDTEAWHHGKPPVDFTKKTTWTRHGHIFMKCQIWQVISYIFICLNSFCWFVRSFYKPTSRHPRLVFHSNSGNLLAPTSKKLGAEGGPTTRNAITKNVQETFC